MESGLMRPSDTKGKTAMKNLIIILTIASAACGAPVVKIASAPEPKATNLWPDAGSIDCHAEILDAHGMTRALGSYHVDITAQERAASATMRSEGIFMDGAARYPLASDLEIAVASATEVKMTQSPTRYWLMDMEIESMEVIISAVGEAGWSGSWSYGCVYKAAP
jgi:hypothetical protein